MDIKMPSGCVFSTEDTDLIEQFLKYGGEEVKPKAKANKKATDKVEDKAE